VKICVCKGHQLESQYVVKSVSAAKETSEVTDVADEDTEFWSLDGLRNAQKNDADVAFILNLMEKSTEKPPLEVVDCQSEEVRVLWGMWPRLRVWNGILQRRFVSVDGSTITWQVILPKQMRREFLTVIHGKMTGGHLARRRTAASIQARAFRLELTGQLGPLTWTCS